MLPYLICAIRKMRQKRRRRYCLIPLFHFVSRIPDPYLKFWKKSPLNFTGIKIASEQGFVKQKIRFPKGILKNEKSFFRSLLCAVFQKFLFETFKTFFRRVTAQNFTGAEKKHFAVPASGDPQIRIPGFPGTVDGTAHDSDLAQGDPAARQFHITEQSFHLFHQSEKIELRSAAAGTGDQFRH